MTARMYYDQDADPAALQGQRIAVLGYGSQGHAHALNLRDSGLAVEVFARADATRDQAEAEDLVDDEARLVRRAHHLGQLRHQGAAREARSHSHRSPSSSPASCRARLSAISASVSWLRSPAKTWSSL